MIFQATSPVHLHFRRGGGAVIGGRVSIWDGTGPDANRVAVALFDHPTARNEDASPVLNPGFYTAVFQTFIRKDLNGRYSFNLEVDDQVVFAEDPHGDVASEPGNATLLEGQFDIHVN